MQLDELLALLGPTGILAMGEDVRIKTKDGTEKTTKGVVSLADGSTDVEIGTGQVLIAEPEPQEGTDIMIRGEPYVLRSVKKHDDGYFKCWFWRSREVDQ
ncbi:MAG: hypothetical protein AAGH41_09055 [Pseudomonadota bacterium]